MEQQQRIAAALEESPPAGWQCVGGDGAFAG